MSACAAWRKRDGVETDGELNQWAYMEEAEHTVYVTAGMP